MTDVEFVCKLYLKKGKPTGPALFEINGDNIEKGMAVRCITTNCPKEIASGCSRQGVVARVDYSKASEVPLLDWAGAVDPILNAV